MSEPVNTTQLERFKKIAKMIECDEDEAHWDERLKKVAKGPKRPQAKDS